MAFIPKDAKWYLADLVIAILVGTDKKAIVHVNTVLVRAGSPREAHERAVALGREEGRLRYQNIDGEWVKFRFLGLGDLTVVHDDLEHGCELRYRQAVGRTMAQARALVTPRARLSVFAPRVPFRGPDYMSGDVRMAINAMEGGASSRKKHRRRA